MELIKSLKHMKWDCKYHIVWIPKYRRKVLYGDLREYLGEVLSDLAQQKETKVLEGHLLPYHVHKLLTIPPNGSSPSGRIHKGEKCNMCRPEFW
jgi:putative transposase